MEQVNWNLLKMIPRLRAVGREVDGKVHVVMPKFRRRWKARVASAFGIRNRITVKLDARSSAAWRLIDGKRTIREIGAGMRDEFGGKIEPLYPRLATLLMVMERNGLIGYRKTGRRKVKKRVLPDRAVADAGDSASDDEDVEPSVVTGQGDPDDSPEDNEEDRP